MIRYTPEEKMEIIHVVEHSDLSVKKTLEKLQVEVIQQQEICSNSVIVW